MYFDNGEKFTENLRILTKLLNIDMNNIGTLNTQFHEMDISISHMSFLSRLIELVLSVGATAENRTPSSLHNDTKLQLPTKQVSCSSFY